MENFHILFLQFDILLYFENISFLQLRKRNGMKKMVKMLLMKIVVMKIMMQLMMTMNQNQMKENSKRQ